MQTLHFALFLYRLTPPDGVQLAFVLGVSKKEALMRQEISAVNRFLFCRGKEVIGQGDMVEVTSQLADGPTRRRQLADV